MTKIEWCDITINPAVGCTKCSPGCDNCYAEKFAARLARHPNLKISGRYNNVVDENGCWTGKINIDLGCFDKLPQKPSRIFVGSMTDLLHPNGLGDNLGLLWKHFARYPQHQFMLLTKRAERLKHLDTIPGYLPLENVWLGVTVCVPEDLKNIINLFKCPAAHYFVSLEPLLGEISLSRVPGGLSFDDDEYDALRGCGMSRDRYTFPHITLNGPRLEWVIVGGETGKKARFCYAGRVRYLYKQCAGANVPFFFKGWGEFLPDSQNPAMQPALRDGGLQPCHDSCGIRVGRRKAGRLLDGQEHNDFPVVGDL